MGYKKVAAALIAVAIIGSTSYATAGQFLFGNVLSVSAASSLRKNSTGSEVTKLQNNLITLNYLKSGAATGTYDSATENAVRKFQADYNLDVDGVAGTKTINLINSLVSGSVKSIEVKATLLNVREEASTSGRVLTTVKAGQKFAVDGEASDSDGTKWYKITTKFGSGYVCSDYVTIASNVSENTSQSSTDAKNGIIKVTGTVLNVRKSASTSSTKLYTVKLGQTYYYTDIKKVDGETWYYIKVNNKVSGWVLGKWATPIQTESAENTSSNVKSGKLKVIVNILNVRQSPSTSSKRLYTTKRDEVYSYSNVKKVDNVDWYYIKVNNSISGWVLGTMVSVEEDSSASTTSSSTESQSTTAADSKSGKLTIAVDALNIRESASTSSKKLYVAKNGQVYSYSDVKKVDNDDWYYIKVNNSISGWVFGSMVKAEPSVTTTAADSSSTTASTDSTTSNQQTGSGKLTIEANVLNVRSDASTDSKIITTVKKSGTYSYTDVKNVDGQNWYYITVSSSKKGWVNGSYVTVSADTTQTTTGTTETTSSATETTAASSDPVSVSGKLTVKADLLNVRSEASTAGQIVTTVKKGKSYTFSQTKSDGDVTWYYIKVSSSHSGWVMGDYVNVTQKDTPDSVTIKNGTLTVIGTSVNVREGAGTSYNKITTVKNGDTYEYIDVKDGWYCIKLSDTQNGWIIGDYVKATEGQTTPTTTTATDATSSSTQASATESSTTATSTTTGVPVSPTAAASITKTVTVGTVKVSANTLVVRSGAGSSYSKIGSVKNGDTVVIISKGSSWHQIEYGTGSGYVSASCIKNITTKTINVPMSYSEDYYYISPGQSINLGRDAGGAAVSYSSSDTKNCPVTDKGVASGVKAGLYEITAKSGSSSASVCVVVLKAANKDVNTFKISEEGAKFITEWEGGGTVMPDGQTFYYPYKDVSGFWTIGCGHAKTSAASKSWTEARALEEFNKDIEELIGADYKLTADRPYLTQEAAMKLLYADLNECDYVKAINDWAVRNGVKLNQAQFDALVSFCYNIGTSLWTNDSYKFYLKSAILAYRNGNDVVPEQVIDGFCRYHKSDGNAYKGLWYRRRNEAELFLTGDYEIDRENKFKLPTDISWS